MILGNARPERAGTHSLPSAISRSTVLTGATTMNGIPCRAASTAALYVPIYKFVSGRLIGTVVNITLFAVSPFRAMRSAPTAGVKKHQLIFTRKRTQLDHLLLTDCMDIVVLKERSDHCITNHYMRCLQRL